MKKTSLQDRQTLDQILMDVYVGALKEGMLKPRHISEAKQAIKQSLLAKMPEKRKHQRTHQQSIYAAFSGGDDPSFDPIAAYNSGIDDCIKVIEKEL